MKDAIMNKIFNSKQTIHFSLLFFFWCLSFILIFPTGQFPLADDWAYAKTVEIFIRTHHIQILDWYAMSFITQLFWGALFATVFGFSFFVLRVSTIVISLIGVYYFYKLFKKICNEEIAFIATLIYCFNPLYLSLTYSFMTDVPFMSLTVIALYFYIESFQSKLFRSFIIATIITIIATLLRQMGIILPFAFFIALLLTNKYSIKWKISALFGFIVTVTALVALQKWYAATGNLSIRFGGIDEILKTYKSGGISDLIFSRFASLTMVTGFLLFPYFFVFKPRQIVKISDAIIAFILCLPVIYYWNGCFPGNYINNFHHGPLTFKDSFGSFLIVAKLVKNRPFELIKIAVLFSGFIVFIRLIPEVIVVFNRKETDSNRAIKILALAYIAAHTAFYFSSPIVFDRRPLQGEIFK